MARNWLKWLRLGPDAGTPTQSVDTTGQAKTGAQSRGASCITLGRHRELEPLLPCSYETYRRIRKHPTVALARAMSIAPLVAAEWSVEETADAPREAKEFIETELLSAREDLIRKIAENGCDFGWSPFEKVFQLRDGFVSLRKLKPLLHDLTTILVDKDGNFQGFRQPGGSGAIEVPLDYSFNVPFRVEGTNWYGEPLLENVREPYSRWQACDKGAERYDRKLAGSNWVVYYPPGSTPVDGGEVDNAEIAAAVLLNLESSGSVSVPAMVKQHVESMNAAAENGGWKIDVLGDTIAKQYSFVARAEYLDKLLVRGLLTPERSLLEASEGTRADAGEHAEGAITLRETEHRYITRHVNWYVVDQLLALNFGDQYRGSVYFRAEPISDGNRSFLREVYRALLTNPASFAEIASRLNFDGLTDALGLPVNESIMSDPASRGMDRTDPLAAIVQRLYQRSVDRSKDRDPKSDKDAA